MSRRKNPSQITLRQIAQKAGVSVATVSRTFSNPSKVATLTRKQVENIVKELGYIPELPKLQPQQNANTILLIISRDDLSRSSELLLAIKKEITEKNYSLLMLCIESTSELFLNHLLLSRQLCGLLFLHLESLVFFQKQNQLLLLPKVIINGFTSHHISASISIDNLSAAFHAVSYLYQLGHHRIACISGPTHYTRYKERTLGYLQALKRWAIAIEQPYIIEAEPTFQGGIAALDKLLALPVRPTAIFCHSDFQALGVLFHARHKGLNIPKSLSVIGFGNIKMAQYSNPSLTSVGYSVSGLAKRAFSLLTEQIEQGINITNGYQLECELIVRESTILLHNHLTKNTC